MSPHEVYRRLSWLVVACCFTLVACGGGNAEQPTNLRNPETTNEQPQSGSGEVPSSEAGQVPMINSAQPIDSESIDNFIRNFGAILMPTDPSSTDSIGTMLSDEDYSDNHSIDFTYEWFRNDDLIAGQTGASLDPAIAVFGDSIHAHITAVGVNITNTIETEAVLVADSPAALVFSEFPSTFVYGIEHSFNVKFSDPDGTPVQTALVAAPSGLSYTVDGTVTWTPTPAMLSLTETFLAVFQSSDGIQQEVKLVVENSDYKAPTARSGIDVPRIENNIYVGDFDNDGRTELLTTNSDNKIFTAEFTGEKLQQDWMYPFLLEDTSPIIKIAPSGPDQQQIMVVTEKQVILIESRERLGNILYEPEKHVLKAIYSDLNGNGRQELVLLLENQTIEILDSSTWQPVHTIALKDAYSDSYWLNQRSTIIEGNVDSDSAIEIITSSGEVIDGVTGQIEWLYSQRFGSPLAVGDIDGDGLNEILGTGNGTALNSFDARSRTKIGALGLNDVCSIELFNIDNDPQQEVFTAVCGHGELTISDASTGKLVLEEMPDRYSGTGASSITIADIDGDNKNEMIWVTGTYDTSDNNLYISAIEHLNDATPAQPVSNIDTPYVHAFILAGRAEITPDKTSTVVTIPTSGDLGSRAVFLGTLTDTGTLDISDEPVGDGWAYLGGSFLIDSDGDGIVELILGTGKYDDGELQHRRLDDFSTIYTHTDLGMGPYYNVAAISTLAPATLSDGTAVAIIGTEEKKLQIFDITGQTVRWTSPALSGSIERIIPMQDENGVIFLVLTNEQLMMWRPSGNVLINESIATVDCSYIEVFKKDSVDTIACIQQESVIDGLLVTFDAQLMKQSEIDLTTPVTALGVMPSEANDQLILGVNSSGIFYDDEDGHLVIIDPVTGLEIWKSMKVAGTVVNVEAMPDKITGQSRITFTTSEAVYISR